MSQDKDRLEIEYHTNPHNIQVLCPLAEIYLAENRIERAYKLIEAALREFSSQFQNQTIAIGLLLLDVSLKLWKADRFASRGNVRLNISSNRHRLLEDIHKLCNVLSEMRDRGSFQSLSLKSAYVQECLGAYQDTLAILSDLITMQATEGVDLSYIIFKASILLRHVGHVKQSIEYLEFVADDPPQQGLNRLHVAAYGVTVYELSGDKYKVFLAKAYRDLVTVIVQEADPKVNGATAKQYKRLETLTKNPTVFQTSSEFWEIVALQALERCEYVLAAEFLMVAIQKATNNAPMQHYLAEVLWLLGEKELAESNAERAFSALPQSAELRNLLLLIAPEIWTEKIRFLSPTKIDSQQINSNIGGNALQTPPLTFDPSASVLTQLARPSSSGGGGGLVSRLRSSAASAMQVFQRGGAASSTTLSVERDLPSPNNSRPSSPTKPAVIKEEDEHELSLSIGNRRSAAVAASTENSNSFDKNAIPASVEKVKPKSKYGIRPSSYEASKGNRRPIQGKPLKPPPITDNEEKQLLHQLHKGNTNVGAFCFTQ